MGRKKNKRRQRIDNNDAVPEENCDAKINTSDTKDISDNDEFGFEPYLPSGDRVMGREYFVHSLCQLCKKELPERHSCQRCGLLSYCSPEHRRLHWPEHSELCSAVMTVCQTRGESHMLQSAPQTCPDTFRLLRLRNMHDCELAVARPLENWEKEMFIFPRVCSLCHEYKEEALVTCAHCTHTGFCRHHRTDGHQEGCANLTRYKRVVKDQKKFGVACPAVPIPLLSPSLTNLTDINNAFKRVRNYLNESEFLELTEIVTFPLTVLNTLKTLKNTALLKSENIVLHVVGAESDFETNKLEKWEYYVLHLLPELKHLQILFIGPELKTTQGNFKVCTNCQSAGKNVSFKFESRLYHELNDSQCFRKPDIVCVFNPGLYRMTGFNGQDTWTPSIVKMFSYHCPVLTTAYTHKEVFLDVDRVKLAGSVVVEKEPSLNPFSSLKPNLNFVSDEDSPVIFKNQFYCIMSKA